MSGLQSSTHWGPVRAGRGDDGRLEVRPHEIDDAPSDLVANMDVSRTHQDRVLDPWVRKSWLDYGPGSRTRRSTEEFVRVPWSTALDLVAGELDRVVGACGPAAVYGGSYGWGSAGRFHHAQSQVHRFLNTLGGYTRSLNTYSTGASSVVLPHVLGADVDAILGLTSWSVLTEHTSLVLAFGGLPAKNLQVAPGGVTRHESSLGLRRLLASGVEVVSISPVRADCSAGADVTWLPIKPGADVALMLALVWTLIDQHLHDEHFLTTRCTGYGELEDYVLGRVDGVPKDPEWAALITGIDARTIRELAVRAAANRTFVSVTWSLQRAEHGEQPPWAGIALAAALGEIGLPGGGFGHGYGSMGDVGVAGRSPTLPTLPQGRNPVEAAVPVARVADMLLNPGGQFEYNGGTHVYPDIRLVYWCGGNPFHHHQNLPRLEEAFGRPDTVVVHEPFWTATARRADIVLPVATSLERADIGASRRDAFLIAMEPAHPPPCQARTDHEIFAGLASRLGTAEEFTGGRDERAWLRHMYEEWRDTFGRSDVPDFESFWGAGLLEIPGETVDEVMLEDFVRDPAGSPLSTPSGRIELYSETIASFGYDDCPGHPAWLEPSDGPTARHPLALVTTQPAARLHSQLDMGTTSQATKVRGREPVLVHVDDARERGITDGDLVELVSARGSCQAGAVLTQDIRPGCLQMATGAWYLPEELPDGTSTCTNGNVNALTADRGTSRLAQGCSGVITHVDVRPLDDQSTTHPVTAAEGAPA